MPNKTQVKKHLAIRHDGVVTIIPDAIRLETYMLGGKAAACIDRASGGFMLFKNVEEISSPYTQDRSQTDEVHV
jgi:hypothetical protein